MAKVIIIGPAHPLRGGLASFDERLARAFQANNDEVIIYTFSLQYPSFLFPGTTQYSDETKPEDLNIKVCINSINPINWWIIGKELKKLKPEIIIVRFWLPFMGPCLGTILRLIRSNHYTKFICIADNVIPHEKRIGDDWFTKYFLKAPDAFITMSEKVNQDLKLFQPTKPSIVVDHPLYDNFGIALDKINARGILNIPKEDPIVLFFGFIRKYKGLDLLLEAIPKLENKNIKILVAGEFYEDEKPYLDIIERLNIKNRIYWHTHFISDSEVKYYLSAADVIIQPYKNATQSGVTPLAYHFEIPMIVTNVGALPRLVPHEIVGLVCEPNASSIAHTIDRFFTLDQNIFIQHIKIEKKKLSWEFLIESIKNMYHDLEK